MIPKIIHYCWFGDSDLSPALKECIETWKTYMPDYQIMCWDNSNCSFSENEYVKRAYAEKRWAYVSDYYRLKALSEYGGIYLDTDVRVRKSFDPLLSHKCFVNFIYDCVIGGGVIGTEPHGSFVSALLDLYEKASFGVCSNGLSAEIIDDRMILNDFDTNNFIFTYYVLEKYPQFRLNNMYQDLGDFVIYPKELFEVGSLLYRHYSIHLGIGSWKDNKKTERQNQRARQHGFAYELFRIIKRKIRYHEQNKSIYFYSIQRKQTKK